MSLDQNGGLARAQRRLQRPRGLLTAMLAGTLLPLGAAHADDQGFGEGPSVIDAAYSPAVLGEPVDSFTGESVSYLGAWDSGGSSFSLSFTSFSRSYCPPVWCEPVYCAPVFSYSVPAYTTYYPPVYSYSYSYWRPTYYASYWSPPAYGYSACAPSYTYVCDTPYWRPSYSPSYGYTSGLSLNFVFGDFDRRDDGGWWRGRSHYSGYRGGRDGHYDGGWSGGRRDWRDDDRERGGRERIERATNERGASFALNGPNLSGAAAGPTLPYNTDVKPAKVIGGRSPTIGVRPGMSGAGRSLQGVKPSAQPVIRDLGGVRPQMPSGPRGLVGVTPRVDPPSSGGPTFVQTPAPAGPVRTGSVPMGPTAEVKPSSQPKVIRGSRDGTKNDGRSIASNGGSLQSAPQIVPSVAPRPVKSVKPNADQVRPKTSAPIAMGPGLSSTPTPKVRANAVKPTYADAMPSAPTPRSVRDDRSGRDIINSGAPIVQPRPSNQPRPQALPRTQAQPRQQIQQVPRRDVAPAQPIRSAPRKAAMGPSPQQEPRAQGGRSSGGGGGKVIRKKN